MSYICINFKSHILLRMKETISMDFTNDKYVVCKIGTEGTLPSGTLFPCLRKMLVYVLIAVTFPPDKLEAMAVSM